MYQRLRNLKFIAIFYSNYVITFQVSAVHVKKAIWQLTEVGEKHICCFVDRQSLRLHSVYMQLCVRIKFCVKKMLLDRDGNREAECGEPNCFGTLLLAVCLTFPADFIRPVRLSAFLSNLEEKGKLRFWYLAIFLLLGVFWKEREEISFFTELLKAHL